MAQLIPASNGGHIQAVKLPATGNTTNITSVVGSAASASALAEGLYRIYSPIDAYICAGATAAGTDLPLPAGSVEYFYFDGTAQLAAYCAAADSVISATLV